MANPNIEKAKSEISRLMDDEDEDVDDTKTDMNKPDKKIIISPIKQPRDTGNIVNNPLQNERIIPPLEPINFPNMNSEFKDGVLAKFLIDGIVKEYISDDLKSVNEKESESENIV